MSKCAYCDKEISGSGRRFYFHRFKKFEIVPVVEEADPNDFLPKRENVCRECLEDMGIRVQP